MQEMRVRSLGWEDPLEKEIATHSCILAWEIPQTEEPGRPWSMGVTESDTTGLLNNNKMHVCVYIYIVGYYLAIEKNEILPFINLDQLGAFYA